MRTLVSSLPAAGASWFRDAAADVERAGATSDLFGRVWSGAGRRLGQARLAFSLAQAASLRSEGTPFVPEGWGADEAGRAVLLLAALAHMPAASRAPAVSDLYLRGEMRERQAVLKVLAYLPEPAAMVDLAAEAVRSNILSVLEALACDNPFPAAHMPDGAWNQMIMKCLFNGLALARVEGLTSRRNPELLRMVAAFASERRAAGRPVPDDVARLLEG